MIVLPARHYVKDDAGYHREGERDTESGKDVQRVRREIKECRTSF